MLDKLHRLLLTRCAHCGGRFGRNEHVGYLNWEPGTWLSGEQGVYHRKRNAERSCFDAAMAELHGEHDPEKARMAIRRVA